MNIIEYIVVGFGLGFLYLVCKNIFIRIKRRLQGIRGDNYFETIEGTKAFFKKFPQKNELYIEETKYEDWGSAGSVPVDGRTFYVENPEQMATDVIAYLKKKGYGGDVWDMLSSKESPVVVAHVPTFRSYFPCLGFKKR